MSLGSIYCSWRCLADFIPDAGFKQPKQLFWLHSQILKYASADLDIVVHNRTCLNQDTHEGMKFVPRMS